MLSAAKHLAHQVARPFASLRVTRHGGPTSVLLEIGTSAHLLVLGPAARLKVIVRSSQAPAHVLPTRAALTGPPKTER